MENNMKILNQEPPETLKCGEYLGIMPIVLWRPDKTCMKQKLVKRAADIQLSRRNGFLIHNIDPTVAIKDSNNCRGANC